jgi:hypothetical protein
MLAGGLSGCLQPDKRWDDSVFNPPTTMGMVVVVVTLWSETELIRRKTPNMTTPNINTAAAGQILVVVVSGGFGRSLTTPS